MPIHLMKSLPIDDEYILQESIVTDNHHINAINQYLINNNIQAEVIQSSCNKIDIHPHQEYTCPIHNRIHSADNLFARPRKNKVILYCYRTESGNHKQENIEIPL